MFENRTDLALEERESFEGKSAVWRCGNGAVMAVRSE